MANTLASWAAQASQQASIPRARQAPDGLLFAFYGRMSTEDYQDPVTSRQWQWANATELISGKGTVVTEFFDIGFTRRLRWPRRPQAAALLEAVADTGRGFSAVVIGEYERAFYGNQFAQIAVTLRRHNVALWMPEVDGPVDFSDPDHQALMQRLGMRAKLEVWRAQTRVIAAMQEQAREQGRFLGGRPPYGYRLVDAGLHPNKAHALWGRRLHRLEPDPETARHVEWIFAERLAGHSVASIVRDLNAKGVPCPSEADPDRNPHRSGDGWHLRTVAAILANPRYTGRQVWNRQYTDHNPDDPKNQARRGAKDVMRWNPPDRWVISNELAHAPLISEPDFVTAQNIRVAPQPQDGTTRAYALSGMIRCGICGRKFDSHWVNNRPGYRCRHGYHSAKTPEANRLKALYVREDWVLTELARGVAASGRSRWAEVEQMLRSKVAVVTAGYGGVELTVTQA